MNEPSPHSSRLLLAGGLAAVIVLGGAGFLMGRFTAQPEPADVPQVEIPPPIPDPAPALPAVLGRRDLIQIAAEARDALASGREPESAHEPLDGKRFELRLPFGCEGPADESSALSMRWRYEQATATLRLHVTPVTWASSDWGISGKEPAGEALEAGSVEGFWIDRPWTSSENCPAPPFKPDTEAEPETEDVEAMPAAEQSLAIGQVFKPERGTRAGQREGKPYSNVLRVPAEELDTSQGFRLRLTGRITRLPTGGVVHCQQTAASGQRPNCLIGAQFDEVAIENPANGENLATWRVGHR